MWSFLNTLLDNGYTMNIPYEVRQLVTIIESYNPILVGGCVRGSLMGIEPKDFDIVVDRLDMDLLDIIIVL